ncbi:MAG: phospho-N-acetylmuramoyl-pentapeptide-transferase [Bacillota bacterium]|nr:phospho-N-acetylmuramoyl-pentapeptide-transferase [Bacillota bacterium]
MNGYDGLRLGMAVALSFTVVAVGGQIAIPLLRRLKVGQRVRDDGPQTHLKKMGVPTMGGLFFVLPGLAVALYFAGRDPAVRATALFALVFAGVGFVDDYIKVVKKRPLGLRARYKLAVQIPAAVALAFYATGVLGLGTGIRLPFGGPVIELAWAYPAAIAFIAVAEANAVNITDGLDGLLAGAMVPTLGAYLLIALTVGQTGLGVLCAALVGACLGFLLFNHYPARVIMGDVGSLGLGGALVAVAVLTKTELLLALVGLLYLIEALSVTLQVISFQSTGRRIFRMSPLHHHFELLGWSETKVLRWFWAAAWLSGVLGLLGIAGMGG